MNELSSQIPGLEDRATYYHSLLRHDISNKNQIILGYLELLMETHLSSEQREIVNLVHRNVTASNELIKKIQHLHLALEYRALHPFNIKEELDMVLAEFASPMHDHHIKVQQLPIEMTILGDELTREIFSNLIDNAVVHSDATTLTFRGEVQSGCVLIQIMDDGKGIPQHLRPLIFTRRCKGPYSSGSGLGLLLVRTIVETQGGTIELENCDCKGTCFILRFPRSQE